MKTIYEKTAYLLETKEQIKHAIEEKGVVVSDSDSFRSYADKIRNIYPDPSYLHTTIFIDQTISDPKTMVSLIYDNGGIDFIRKNSHRYLCKKVADVLEAKPLNDSDTTCFEDGTAANLSGVDGDVMMKLPRFFYKAWSEEKDKWYVDFAIGNQPSPDYKLWEGDEFIGVYEGCIINNILYSVSDVVATTPLSHAQARQYARNKGEGYSCVTWRMHSIMAFLFLMQYRNTDSQSICGTTCVNIDALLGDSNLLGMQDTIANTEDVTLETFSVNFWGLERWWGGHYEWIDNAVTNEDLTWKIDEGDEIRYLNVCQDIGNSDKMMIGEHLDAAPISAMGTTSTGYCDRYYFSDLLTTKIARSGMSRSANTGIFYIAGRRDDEELNNNECVARLAYKGKYKII